MSITCNEDMPFSPELRTALSCCMEKSLAFKGRLPKGPANMLTSLLANPGYIVTTGTWATLVCQHSWEFIETTVVGAWIWYRIVMVLALKMLMNTKIAQVFLCACTYMQTNMQAKISTISHYSRNAKHCYLYIKEVCNFFILNRMCLTKKLLHDLFLPDRSPVV